MLNSKDIEGFDKRRREVLAKIAALEKLPLSEEVARQLELLRCELKELETPDLP